MNIFIDESGSFVSAPQPESWNVVAAVIAPELARRRIASVIRKLRATVDDHQKEIKLDGLTDLQYLEFVKSLKDAGLVLFATATDAHRNTRTAIAEHQAAQVLMIRKNVPRAGSEK